MPKCTIEKFNPNVDGEALATQFAFCKALTEPTTNGFEWPTVLMSAADLEEFREGLRQLAAKEEYDLDDLRERGFVPQQYWWIKDEQGVPIGVAKIRYVLTPVMLRHGGHVGFGLAEGSRGQGYGTAGLALVIEECRRNGLTDILFTINPNNIASRRIVEKNGGQLWDIIHREKNGDCARYWVHAM